MAWLIIVYEYITYGLYIQFVHISEETSWNAICTELDRSWYLFGKLVLYCKIIYPVFSLNCVNLNLYARLEVDSIKHNNTNAFEIIRLRIRILQATQQETNANANICGS